MTVKELKAMLERFSDDMEVCYAYPARDYWRNTIAGGIKNAVEKEVVFSKYHENLVVAEDVLAEDDENEYKTVVILQS